MCKVCFPGVLVAWQEVWVSLRSPVEGGTQINAISYDVSCGTWAACCASPGADSVSCTREPQDVQSSVQTRRLRTVPCCCAVTAQVVFGGLLGPNCVEQSPLWLLDRWCACWCVFVYVGSVHQNLVLLHRKSVCHGSASWTTSCLCTLTVVVKVGGVSRPCCCRRQAPLWIMRLCDWPLWRGPKLACQLACRSAPRACHVGGQRKWALPACWLYCSA